MIWLPNLKKNIIRSLILSICYAIIIELLTPIFENGTRKPYLKGFKFLFKWVDNFDIN